MPLVLARRVGETVVIRRGTAELRCTVIEMHGGQVKLAFAGPHEFSVMREEVQERIDSGEWQVPRSQRR